MKNYNKKKENVWDEVWKKDVYSEPELRKRKAQKKVEKLLQYVDIKDSTIVLDLGCGGGYISRELYNRTGAQIYGVDSSKEAIELSIKKTKEMPILYRQANVTKLPFKSNFADVILCIGVIEHVRTYQACLREITRVLKKDGIVFVVSSNKNSFIYQQKVIRQKLGLWNYGYQKNWTKDTLEELFISQGFWTQHIEVSEGIGNFKIVDKLDKIFSTSTKKHGRYIYYIGRLKDDIR